MLSSFHKRLHDSGDGTYYAVHYLPAEDRVILIEVAMYSSGVIRIERHMLRRWSPKHFKYPLTPCSKREFTLALTKALQHVSTTALAHFNCGAPSSAENTSVSA